MTKTFTSLIDDCLLVLNDPFATVFPRTTAIKPWAIEAILNFPILRAMRDDHSNGLAIVYTFRLAEDFREVISVEYPVGLTPPTYLTRKNRLDPAFYENDCYFDIDRDYTTGTKYSCYVSGGIAVSAHIYVQYLANHDTAMLDDSTTLLSVPDEYVHILIAYVIAKAYRERLSSYMLDPTAHVDLVGQMTDMVKQAEDRYEKLVAEAKQIMAQSKVTPTAQVDRYDRVY